MYHHVSYHKLSINRNIITMTTNTDPPNTTRTVTCTGAVILTYTGKPVEIISMVPPSEAHKYRKTKSCSDTTDNDSNDKIHNKKNEVKGEEV